MLSLSSGNVGEMTSHAKKDMTVLQMLEEITRNYLVARLCILYLIFTKLAKNKKRKWTQLALPYNMMGWTGMRSVGFVPCSGS
ncbi:hypothetical protein AAHA92_32292 [Salvia divinorum]|uniref:Uncharacterized protein n=1 Tax=Salvia divinorum TaxID=28513 RepID=A0ABD1FNJ2_SALDI